MGPATSFNNKGLHHNKLIIWLSLPTGTNHIEIPQHSLCQACLSPPPSHPNFYRYWNHLLGHPARNWHKGWQEQNLCDHLHQLRTHLHEGPHSTQASYWWVCRPSTKQTTHWWKTSQLSTACLFGGKNSMYLLPPHCTALFHGFEGKSTLETRTWFGVGSTSPMNPGAAHHLFRRQSFSL
jgi:hypothetical protein